MYRIKYIVLLVAVLFVVVFSSLRSSILSSVTAQKIIVQKVIAPAGLLDDSQPGITLWHDYGAFGLYRVTDSALSSLSTATAVRLTPTDEMDRILIDAYAFDTQREALNLPTGWETTAVTGSALQLIQFVGPIKDEWLDTIAANGITPIHYVANNAYLVWADDDGRTQLQSFVQSGDFLQYNVPYQPYFKLGRSLSDQLDDGANQSTVVPVVIQMFQHKGRGQTEAFIQKTLLTVESGWEPVRDFQNIRGTIRLEDIPVIAAQPDVVWVGEQFERQLMDEVQGQILAASFDGGMTGPSGPGYLTWLDGSGFSQNPADYPLVDITDDGIGNGTINSGDPTLHELGLETNDTRLTYVSNCTAATDGGSPDGHGHINVSIAGGYDVRVGEPYQDENGFQRGLGISPYGRFAGTRIFSPYFDLSACGNTDTGLIQHTQNSGAEISSNSWGCGGCAGSYDTSSQAYDIGVRDADLDEIGNQELIFIFAAGNDGPGSSTIGTPGNGKNVITVGASENDRPTWLDGCGISPEGADNIMDVISFSSRGPAPGNRAKPELIAPGTHIQGTASTNDSYNGSGVCDQYQPVGQTTFAASSGTSHSTPAIAGVASLAYYWLENQHNLPSPSPALMKAYLIAHPTYLTGVSANDNLPSNSQGYGMPDMSLAFDDAARIFLDQSAVLDNSGDTWTFSGAVEDPSKPVRIVLAYTDQEGVVGTSPQVNDLNLDVTINGQSYLGNNFLGQWSVTDGAADSANNYEAVFLPIGTSGNITVTVTAFNIAGDGLPNSGDTTDQDFALVCYNCIEYPDFSLQVSPATQAICAPDDAVFDVTVEQLNGYADPVTLSAVSPFTAVLSDNPVMPPGSSQLTLGNTGGTAVGSYPITIWGIAPTSTHTTTISLDLYNAAPGTVMLNTPMDGETAVALAPTFIWTETTQVASYLFEIAEDAAFNTIVYTATVKGTEHTLPQELSTLMTYYWRVQASNACDIGIHSVPFSFTTALIACDSPGKALPDGNTVGISRTITVSQSVKITDLNVWVDVTHSWVGDLSLVLEHEETGSRVALLDRPGYPVSSWGCSGDDIDATFDDEALVQAEDSCNLSGNALLGSMQPNESLSAFDGEFWAGTWRLTAVDTVLYDTGTLNGWCLQPAYEVLVLDRDVFLPLVVR